MLSNLYAGQLDMGTSELYSAKKRGDEERNRKLIGH